MNTGQPAENLVPGRTRQHGADNGIHSQSTYSEPQNDGRPSAVSIDLERHLDATTLNPAQPRPWHEPLFVLPGYAWRRIMGWKPSHSSYVTLYGSLSTFEARLTALVGVLLAIVAGVPLPVIGVIFGKIIGSFPPTEAELKTRISELLGVACGYFLVTAGYTIAFGLTGERISRHLREALANRLVHLDQTYYDTHNPDITALLTEKIETIQVGTSEKVGIFIQSCSYFVAAFTVGFILNAQLTGILFAAVIPTMIIIVVVGSTSISRLAKKASRYTDLASGIAESAIKSVRIVQAFDINQKLCGEYTLLLQKIGVIGVRKSISSAVMLGCVYFTAYSANAIAFYVGSQMSRQDGGNAGTVYAVVFLILDASFVVGQFSPFIQAFALAASAGEEIQDLLRPDFTPSRANETILDLRGKPIYFKDVSFNYPARPAIKTLDRLNLTLQPGKLNAIVGGSGGGKSTLVSLLLKIYDDWSGKICAGGLDIGMIDSIVWRANIAVVEQEAVLFSGSILDNIRHGLSALDLFDEEAIRRCRQAADDANMDFVSDLPRGLDTSAAQLSGGQRQRVCLARALVRNPALLILDEPTSALDATSEQLVLQAVKHAATLGTMVVMVAHRLSTVTEADQIFVMASGRVAEQGTHSFLLTRNGLYKNMIDAQTLNHPGSRSTEYIVPEEASLGKTRPEKLESSTSSVLGSSVRSASSSSEVSSSMPQDQKRVQTPKTAMRKLLLRCAQELRPDHLTIALGLFTSVISGGLLLGEAIVFGNLIELLKASAIPNFQGEANFYCLMFFVLACIALASYLISGSTFGIASAKFTSRLQQTSLATVLRQDIAWFSEPEHSQHKLMSRLTSDIGNISCLSGVALGTILTVTTSVAGGIILAHIIAWKIALVLLCVVPVMIAAGYVRLRILSLSEDRHRSAYNDAAAIATEACRNIRTVAILGRKDSVMQQYKDALHKPYKEGLLFTMYANVILALSFAITYFVYALAYWWGSTQVRKGNYTEKDFFIVLPALLFSAQAAGQLFSLSPEITRAKGAARSVFQLHDEKPTIMIDEINPLRKSTSRAPSLSSDKEKSLARATGSIQFSDVTLAYGSASRYPALRNVTFSIDAGRTVAFVGPSGAGKSSSIALLERFFDPSTGHIQVDGEDIRSLPVVDHRARLGLVPQEPDLFPGSILYNIRLGAAPGQSIKDKQIESVCKQLGLHDFIMSLPEAYNTDCGSNSTSKLSGGQKQRIAVARALIRDPEILLLDEPTSALDTISERQVQDALAIAADGRTTVIVAHRLASIRHVDNIFVFNRGRFVEEGDFDSLVGRNGLFASMARAQSLV